MWRLAVLVSALTVIPSLAVAQQPCTADARQVIEQVYRQVLERSADPRASDWLDQFEQGRYGSRNRSRHRQIARTSAAGWQPRPGRLWWSMSIDIFSTADPIRKR